jgi:hypothetical protein
MNWIVLPTVSWTPWVIIIAIIRKHGAGREWGEHTVRILSSQFSRCLLPNRLYAIESKLSICQLYRKLLSPEKEQWNCLQELESSSAEWTERVADLRGFLQKRLTGYIPPFELTTCHVSFIYCQSITIWNSPSNGIALKKAELLYK